jgi:cardiolipin synthase
LAPLERAGDRITQHRAERGTAVTVLHNGDEAYPKMIAAIEAAEASVAWTSFIFRADDAPVAASSTLWSVHADAAFRCVF